MNQEISRKLKNGEFPGHGKDCSLDGCSMQGCYPTLKELIETCGENINELFRDGGYYVYGEGEVKTYRENCWVARDKGYKKDCPGKCGSSKTTYQVGEGSTTEEAVANLWLALHKK